MKVTIQYIAELAGVSRGTVDKVIHGRAGVSDEVREKVKTIIDEVGYNPNRAAKALTICQKETCIAVVIPRLSNPYFQEIKAGMDDAVERFRDYGLEIEYYYSDGVEPQEVVYILQYLKNKNIAGLVIRGIENDAIVQQLREFTVTGTPIITYDSDLSTLDRVCFIGEDHERSGRIAASLLAKSIGQQGDVAVLIGSSNIRAHALRAKGFNDVMKESYPNINVVDVCQTLEQNVIAYDKTHVLLQQYPNLNGIFNAASCSQDIAQALKDNHRAHLTKMITYNFTNDIITLVKDGTVDFTIGLAPRKQGDLTITTLFNYIAFGEKPTQNALHIPLHIGLDENIDLFL